MTKTENHTSRRPFFSIITASLNSAATLRDTLESVSRQTFQNVEHIVIDGGSADDTVSLLEAYEEKYDLKWISEPDSGIASALNKGLSLSQGEYIIVIHADDNLIAPNICAYAYKLLENRRWDIFSSPVYVIHPTREKILYKPVKRLWWHRFKTIFPHQGCFVHRRIFERIGGFREDLKIAVDYDFFYRALDAKASVCFRHEPVAIMCGSGISNNPAFLAKRLAEERAVQNLNETSPMIRILQRIFWIVYEPYKLRLCPAMSSKPRKGR